MNVASLELSKKLYELSGWDFGENKTTSMHYIEQPFNENVPDLIIGHVIDGGVHPAYDCGYLLRKLHEHLDELIPQAQGRWAARGDFDSLGVDHKYFYNNTPEDALCLLAIKLFEEGVLNAKN